MAGPWEEYQSKPKAETSGPWDQYKSPKGEAIAPNQSFDRADAMSEEEMQPTVTPAVWPEKRPTTIRGALRQMQQPGFQPPKVEGGMTREEIEAGGISAPFTGAAKGAVSGVLGIPSIIGIGPTPEEYRQRMGGVTRAERPYAQLGEFTAPVGTALQGITRGVKGLMALRRSPTDMVQQWASDFARTGFAGSKNLEEAAKRGMEAETGFASVQKQLQDEIAKLRTGAEQATQSRIDELYQQANKRLAEIRQNAEQAANELRASGQKNAETAYNQIISAAENRIEEGRNFLNRYNALVERTLSGAEQVRAGIGRGDITAREAFTPVRERAVQSVEAERGRLKATDDVLRSQLDEVVSQAEAAGRGIDSTPTYRELTNTIDTLMRKDESGLSPFARMEPSKQKLYEKINEYLRPKPVKITKGEYEALAKKGDKSVRELKGVNEAGEEVTTYMRDLRPSMNDIDGLRRWLGKVFAGKIEGFEAIAGTEKESLYKLLDKMENEYAATDDLFKRMQTNYRQHMDKLRQFEIRTGSKLLEKEAGTERFKTDVEQLGGLFKTQSQIDDLLNVTGDAETVRATGRNMIARDLVDANAAKVRQIITSNRGMFEHPLFSDLRADLERLEGRLKRAETAISVREKAGRGGVKIEGGKIVPEVSVRTKAMEEAEKARTETIAKFEKEASEKISQADKIANKELAERERRAAEIKRTEKEKTKQAKREIEQKYGVARNAFGTAMRDARVNEKAQALQAFARMVEREKGVRGVYEPDQLLARVTNFLRDDDVVRLVPPEILAEESRKIGRIMEIQDKKEKMAAIKRELAILGSQAVSGRVKSALGTALRLPGKF